MNLLDYVRSLTGEYGKEENGSWKFHSPFRRDSTPSFSVRGERWTDFGESGRSNDLIALIRRVENCTFMEAISKVGIAPQMIEKKNDHVEKAPNEWEIKPITHSRLFEYAGSRYVRPELLSKYCVELHEDVFIKGKKLHFFYIAFKNEKNGYAIRSAISDYKSNRGQTSYSFLEGENKACVLVFEGMFDFLSYFSQDCLKTSAIVLNSVTNKYEAIPILKKFSEVHLYLDNDKAGDEATDTILQYIPYAIDHRTAYRQFNDVNEYIVARNKNK